MTYLSTTYQDENINLLKKELTKNIGNDFVKEQYKLVIDSAHKIAERAKDSNSIYITVSSIFIPFLIKFFDMKNTDFSSIVIFSCLIGVGILICINWLAVITAYKKINHVNYIIISLFEEYLPTSVFSIRAQLTDPPFQKGTYVQHKDRLIPYIFMTMYVVIYIIFILIHAL